MPWSVIRTLRKGISSGLAVYLLQQEILVHKGLFNMKIESMKL